MFEDRIAALNKEETEMPLTYEKRIYTVDEIQDILGIGRNCLLYTSPSPRDP